MYCRIVNVNMSPVINIFGKTPMPWIDIFCASSRIVRVERRRIPHMHPPKKTKRISSPIMIPKLATRTCSVSMLKQLRSSSLRRAGPDNFVQIANATVAVGRATSGSIATQRTTSMAGRSACRPKVLRLNAQKQATSRMIKFLFAADRDLRAHSVSKNRRRENSEYVTSVRLTSIPLRRVKIRGQVDQIRGVHRSENLPL